MGECQREIQVRSLAGESTTVSISPNQTIRNLKLLLTQTFPPASISPNFHLFLKGVKLSLQTKISSHSIEPGEFMVLVPYVKKDQQQTQPDNEVATHSNGQNELSTSEASDSAWSDMMQDLSFLRDIAREESQSNVESKSMNSEDSNKVTAVSPINQCSETKLKKRLNSDTKEGHIENLIISILRSSESIQLDEKNCNSFLHVLESVNCLSNPQSGNCMLRETYLHGSEGNPYGDKNNLCLCPSWLKTIVKSFYFLNIYSAYLQLQGERITSTCLKEVLDQLNKFGLQIGLADLEQLSVLCPQVVRFVNGETGVKNLFDVLVIMNASLEERCEVQSTSDTA